MRLINAKIYEQFNRIVDKVRLFGRILLKESPANKWTREQSRAASGGLR